MSSKDAREGLNKLISQLPSDNPVRQDVTRQRAGEQQESSTTSGSTSSSSSSNVVRRGTGSPAPPPPPVTSDSITRTITGSIYKTPETVETSEGASYIGQNEPISLGLDKSLGTNPIEQDKGMSPAYYKEEHEAGRQLGMTDEELGRRQVTDVRRKQYSDYLKWKRTREDIRSNLSGERGEGAKALEVTRQIAGGFLSSENPLNTSIIGEYFFGEGTKKDKRERILDISTNMVSRLDPIARTSGATGLFLESYKPGGFGFSVTSSAIASYGAGAAVGGFKATSWGSKVLITSRGLTSAGKPFYSITPASLIEGGFVGYGAYESGSIYKKYGMSGLGKSVVSSLPSMAVAIPLYRKGFKSGFGRTEAYLYKIHTYEPGTPDFIRFEKALKISRTLEPVKSHKLKALNITKDIMRMDKKTAGEVINYLEQNPSTVIGGSAASYTQVVGARRPRDIDILVQRIVGGTEKKVGIAKNMLTTRTSKGEHLVDIHGKEFYKPGKYHEFGFSHKKPIKIGSHKYFKAGEQLFRKGISSVKTETSYRHFKDLPDFITHAKSLIISAKKSHNPFTRIRGRIAERDLKTFLNPEAQIDKQTSKISNMIRNVTKKPVQPIRVIELSSTGVGKSSYIYPRSVSHGYYVPISIGYQGGYPLYNIPKTVSSYYPTSSYNIPKIPTINIPSYTSPVQPRNIPTYDIPSIPSVSIPSYNISVQPKKTPSYYPTSSYPSVVPPIKTQPYKTTYITPNIPSPIISKRVKMEDKIVKRRRFSSFKPDVMGVKYRFRELDIGLDIKLPDIFKGKGLF